MGLHRQDDEAVEMTVLGAFKVWWFKSVAIKVCVEE